MQCVSGGANIGHSLQTTIITKAVTDLLGRRYRLFRVAGSTGVYCSQIRISRRRQPFHEAVMHIPFDKARPFLSNEEGAALAEYGILVAFIAIVAITAVTFFGSKISAKFSQIATSFT
jgi:pilus assembly protein Flp/PilA